MLRRLKETALRDFGLNRLRSPIHDDCYLGANVISGFMPRIQCMYAAFRASDLDDHV